MRQWRQILSWYRSSIRGGEHYMSLTDKNKYVHVIYVGPYTTNWRNGGITLPVPLRQAKIEVGHPNFSGNTMPTDKNMVIYREKPLIHVEGAVKSDLQWDTEETFLHFYKLKCID